MYVLALLSAVVMIAMIFLFYHKQEKGRIYIAVIHYHGDEPEMPSSAALENGNILIKSRTMRKEQNRACG